MIHFSSYRAMINGQSPRLSFSLTSIGKVLAICGFDRQQFQVFQWTYAPLTQGGRNTVRMLVSFARDRRLWISHILQLQINLLQGIC